MTENAPYLVEHAHASHKFFPWQYVFAIYDDTGSQKLYEPKILKYFFNRKIGANLTLSSHCDFYLHHIKHNQGRNRSTVHEMRIGKRKCAEKSVKTSVFRFELYLKFTEYTDAN